MSSPQSKKIDETGRLLGETLTSVRYWILCLPLPK